VREEGRQTVNRIFARFVVGLWKSSLFGAVFVVAGLSAVAIPSWSATTAIQCGEWRWPVKTLSDSDAGKVRYGKILDRKVPALRKVTPPSSLGGDSPRYHSVERNVYRLHVALIEAKIQDDHEIHVVVAGPKAKAQTMIVEFPNVKCKGAATSIRRRAMATARNHLLNDCGPINSNKFVKLAGTATITGVGFWDSKHGQTGVAPNGIELHPVLTYRHGTCSKPNSGGVFCTPFYSPCLAYHQGADYDCYGGGGDGPYYTAPGVTYKVAGPDPYALDGDNDGYGCEWKPP
jgi:hypothetical protein